MIPALEKRLLIAVVMLNAYSLGADCVERFVNYGSWHALSEADFASYHRSQQPAILAFVVAPLGISFLLQLALLWKHSFPIRTGAIWVMILSSLVGAVSTALLQIPIHRQLDHGFSPELVSRLMRTDWIRKAADVTRTIASVYLLLECLP